MKRDGVADRRVKGVEEGKVDGEEGSGMMRRLMRWGRKQRDKEARMWRLAWLTMLMATAMQRKEVYPMMTDPVQGPGCPEVPHPFGGEGRQIKGLVIIASKCS